MEPVAALAARQRSLSAPEADPEEKALELDRVTCTFAAGAGSSYTAVRDASLSVKKGEFVAVVGPTGCGKSTLLNVAAGLLSPSSGRFLAFGKPLSGLNRDAAYLFQGEALMPWFSAIENIIAGLTFRGVPRGEALETAQDWLARVGMAKHGDRYPHQMSGGMRKRVALAQAFVLDRPILLMDEPFSALDIQTRHLMETELLDLWLANRKSVLFITHDIEEAIALSDRVVAMSAGPGSSPIADFEIDLPRPRDVADIRLTTQFVAIHAAIWAVLKDEVLKSHARSKD